MSETSEGAGVLIVEGVSLLDRAFNSVAVTSFATRAGEPVNAVHGFLTVLLDAIDARSPTRVVVVLPECDDAGAGQVTGLPAELNAQLPVIRNILTALGITIVEADAAAAGDVVASLTVRETGPGVRIRVLGADARLAQLVTDEINLLRSNGPGSALVELGPARIRERYGVTPERHADLVALCGDPALQLPSVPGVGAKTAARWLREFGDLDAILARVDDIAGRGGASLRAHLDTVRANRERSALTTVDLPAEHQRPPRASRGEIDEIFTDLGLPQLHSRILDGLPDTSGDDGQITELRDAAGWLTEHGYSRRVGVAAEFGPHGDLTAIAVAVHNTAGYLDLATATETDRASVAAWLANPDTRKALHDAKPAIRALRRHGWALHGVDADTALAAYLLAPGDGSCRLGDLAARYLPHRSAEAGAALENSLLGAHRPPAETLVAAARHVAELGDVLDAELARTGMLQLYRTVELALLPVLGDVEAIGVAVDRDKLQELRSDFTGTAARATTAAGELLGEPVNLGSAKQLQTTLFQTLEMPATRATRTGHSTDAAALKSLYDRTGHPFLRHVLDHREATKLRGVVDTLLKAIDSDGRIHTTLTQTVTATGRLSSINPNLQNIPVRSTAGRRIRESFTPATGFDTIMSADYSQIEMRIMAHLSGDPALIAAFESGEDLHRYVAAEAFAVAPADVTNEQRRRAKAISYGLAYGLTARGLAGQLGIGVNEARQHRAAYFHRFGGVRDYLQSVAEQARTTGYTETLLGRRRYLPDLSSANPTRADAAERAALNAPIQGSAADIIKLAMRDVAAALNRSDLRSRMILQIHDELLFEVAPGEHDQLARLLQTAMTTAITLSVPLDIDIRHGTTWAATAH
ncbi:DNA polymerase I [Aldersonia sp. NBC_00410]|uniref:DNA polymerase I n=1 Tax=Aldersonia sp. NBC_00410 TaxID=2975954 RepID=UPI0022577CB2|nr:DNA polymerase I [Aldersonia sp. NBC_00410]MCX5046249.1 DNA polymerase I [Aldersonia sp. NBC_00410]